MLPNTSQLSLAPFIQKSDGDRATLGSDLSTSEKRKQEQAKRRVSSGNTVFGNIGTAPKNPALGASQSDKPKPLIDLQPLLDQIETSLHSSRGRSFPVLSSVRDSVVEELVTLLPAEELDRLERIAHCAEDMVVLRVDGKLKLFPSLCRERMCPICAYYRSLKLKRKLHDTIKRMRRPKLLTLTLKQSSDKLEHQARRLTACFARLRRRKSFQDACKSGFWVLEYTYRADSKTWHVHIHAILDSYFISQEMISSQWLQITGDSYIVDIRKADHRHAGYLAKYVAKNGMFLPPRDQLIEYLKSVKSIRMFGSWGGLKITEDSVLEISECEKVGLLSHIIHGARNGWAPDIVIIAELATVLTVDKPPPPS